MTDITGVGRGGIGAVRAALLGWRILNQRRWYWYLRYQAVVGALMLRDDTDEPVPPEINEAALRICEILDALFVPMEVRGGLFNKIGRWIREKVTQGVRYPLHDAAAGYTYWDRLYAWAREAAETREGSAALDYADFPVREDRSHLFAKRFVAKTSALLLSHALPDSLNRFRERMAFQVHRGPTWADASARHRRIAATARTATAGVASTVLTYVGFNQDLVNSLGIGGLTLASTAVVEATSGGYSGLTEPMKAARRQARDWLATMSLWLVQYVTWRDGEIREGRTEGVHQLLGILTALRAEEATLDRPQDTERIERHLQRLIEAANRVGDTDLETALMNVESAVLYRPAHIVNALSALIALVEGVTDLPGPTPGTSLGRADPPGNVPRQLGRPDSEPLPRAE
ncbi:MULTISPECIES: hypothetical protein [Streptomyces]|uniref:hypothetical protein n=1 Tax=Streptomyces TaxID=1883 RepID=UPI000D67652D|nr:hypothetical protein [Streptomyces sp. NWU49]PWJ07454.1 hypothetical protein DKG34_12910 [Streptomyces sp. NWU49]